MLPHQEQSIQMMYAIVLSAPPFKVATQKNKQPLSIIVTSSTIGFKEIPMASLSLNLGQT